MADDIWKWIGSFEDATVAGGSPVMTLGSSAKPRVYYIPESVSLPSLYLDSSTDVSTGASSNQIALSWQTAVLSLLHLAAKDTLCKVALRMSIQLQWDQL